VVSNALEMQYRPLKEREGYIYDEVPNALKKRLYMPWSVAKEIASVKEGMLAYAMCKRNAGVLRVP
jgi:hypothetical protein